MANTDDYAGIIPRASVCVDDSCYIISGSQDNKLWLMRLDPESMVGARRIHVPYAGIVAAGKNNRAIRFFDLAGRRIAHPSTHATRLILSYNRAEAGRNALKRLVIGRHAY
jgi:hypothetical protein